MPPSAIAPGSASWTGNEVARCICATSLSYVRPWREGEAWLFDDTIEHEAVNPTDQLRAVLILDVWNPHLREDEQRLLAKSLEVADGAGLNAKVAEA